MSHTETIIQLAKKCAKETPEFYLVKGPGAGDKATIAFMKKLRSCVKDVLGADYAEQKICGRNKLAVDFYIPEESTIIEISLSLHNPSSEFEKDVIKAIMAQDEGYGINKLIFLSKKGGINRHSRPGSQAIISWLKRAHEVGIEIQEL